VGIAADASQRLFNDHNVDKKMDIGFIENVKALRLPAKSKSTLSISFGLTAVLVAGTGQPNQFTPTRKRPLQRSN
jgi:hypothetical protein